VNKIYLLIGILCIAPTLSNAETQSVPFEVICDDTTKVVNTLRNEYKEIVILSAKGTGSSQHFYTIWGNPVTGTATIVDTYGPTSCILGIGIDVEIMDYTANLPKS
jgi:hypothetical protein